MTDPRFLLVLTLMIWPPAATAQTAAPQQAPQESPGQTLPPPSSSQGTPRVREIILRPGTIPGVAPEHQEAARKSRESREKVVACQREANEQKVMPRYRTQYVLDCIEKKTN